MEPFHIDLRRDFGKIYEAYKAGLLQITTKNQPLEVTPGNNVPTCQYSGPCAVGFLMTPEQRLAFDKHEGGLKNGVRSLIADGLVTCPAEQMDDIIEIQYEHDVGVCGSAARFENLMETIAHKYAQQEV